MDIRQKSAEMRGENILEEKIALREFTSAEALKAEIRKRITARMQSNWHCSGMATRGGVIYLQFKH